MIGSGLQFLFSTSIDSRAVRVMSQHKGMQLCLKICESYMNERLIAEMNSRMVYMLCYEDNNAELLCKKDILGLISTVMNKRPQWRTMQLYYLKTLNIVIASEQEAIPLLRKQNNLVNIVISTVQQKDYNHILRSIVESRNEKDEEWDEDEDLDEGVVEVFSQVQ